MKKITFAIVLLTISIQAMAQVDNDYNLTQKDSKEQQGFYNSKQENPDANFNKTSDKSDVLQKEDSYGNPIVNETTGLPDWAERDVLALKSEIVKTIERRETLQQTDERIEVIREIEYILGNFIGQALIRQIDINNIVNIFDKSIITKTVAESVLEYLHYYENEKYVAGIMSKNPYVLTKYSQTTLNFIYQYGGNPDELLKIETEIPKSTPSGEYTKYYSYLGMTLLSGATTIWSGLIPWNDHSSNKPIGFDFYFYRGDDPEPNDSVRVSTNGYLTMFQKGEGALDGTDPSNDEITNTTDPDGYLAPWWDDLVIKMQGTTDKVNYKTEGSVGSRVFTVEYYSVTRDGGDVDDYHYFQVKLNEGSNIINFRYGDWNPDSQDNATIGLEDYQGVDGDCGFDCTNTYNTTPTINVNYSITPIPGIWTGETSSDWLTPSNWSDNNIPDGNTDVVIPNGCPNYPLVNGNLYINSPAVNTYECYSLRIEYWADVSVSGISTGSVINRGELIVRGDLYIDDDLHLGDGSITSLKWGIIRTGSLEQYGISNHADGSVFNQEDGGTLKVNGIIIDTLASFSGIRGEVNIHKNENTPFAEIFIYNEDVFFDVLKVSEGVNAVLKGDLLVNDSIVLESELLTIHGSLSTQEMLKYNGSLEIHGSLSTQEMFIYNGSLEIHGSVTTQEMFLYDGVEIIINPLGILSCSSEEMEFPSGSSLYMYSAGSPVPLASYFNCVGDLTFLPGAIINCTSGAWISIGGHLKDDDGCFFGNVSFNGGGNSYIKGHPSFRSLSINTTGYYSNSVIVRDNDVSISEHLFINSGCFNPNGHTVEINGSWNNTVGDSGFKEGMGTVVFTSGDNISYLSDETFYDLIINGTSEVEQGSTINVIDNLEINQEFTINGNSTFLIGNSIDVNNGGILNSIGTGGNKVTFTKYSGFYNFNVFYGGEISASYSVFEYMSTNGVVIHNGATIQVPFNNCTFRYGIFSGSLLTINNNQDITINKAFFPENTWGSIHNVSKTNDQGSVIFENYYGGYTGEAYENDPYNRITWGLTEIFYLDATVLLEGPFNGLIMNTDLNTSGLLPLAQPYSGEPWNYNGTESVASIPNGDIVDWVLIEIRDAVDAASSTPATIFVQQAAFLLNNGRVVDVNGSSLLHFTSTINENLFLVIYHRNHLEVLSAHPVEKTGGVYTYDFTTTADQAFGINAQKNLGSGKYGMYGGDANANGVVNTIDKAIWSSQVGTQGYKSTDFNRNGQTENQDKNDIWVQNIGENSQLPTAPWQCGDVLIDIRDDQTYATIQIGTQCWMAENLNHGTMVIGSTNQTNEGSIEKYCYTNSAGNCDTYGGLYQWDEMMQYSTTPGVQGICPTGWHLPTDEEWCTLENEVDTGTVSCSATGWRGTDVGSNLKEGGAIHWQFYNYATNSSGFTALGGGEHVYGAYLGLTYDANFWTSSMSGSNTSWNRHLFYASEQVFRYDVSKDLGNSVRCLQD